MMRRFEGNAADVNRSKERAQMKRQTRKVLEAEAEDEDETEEELAFRKEQEALQALSEEVQESAYDWTFEYSDETEFDGPAYRDPIDVDGQKI